MNVHIAYISGVLATRGSISSGKVKGNYRIYLTTKNPKLAEKFANMLRLAFGKSPRVVNRNKSYSIILYGKRYVKTVVNFITKVYTNKLRKGLLIKPFLMGIFDFSSNVRLKIRTHRNGRKQLIPQIRVNTKKLKVLRFVKDELKKMGINSSIYRSGNTFTLEVSGKANVSMLLRKVGSLNEERVKKVKSLLGWYEKSRPLVVEVKE